MKKNQSDITEEENFMPNFFQFVLLFVSIFVSAFGFACIIRFFGKYLEEIRAGVRKKTKNTENIRPKRKTQAAEKPTEPVDQPRSDPKIYYIRNAELPQKPKPKRKKRTRPKPDLAFKGIIIQPEEFCEKRYK